MEFVLNHTKFGRYTIAIGSNKEAAALSGINVKFYHVMVYVVCGLFTGLAAIAYAAVTPTVQPGTGAGLEMDAIGGVFVGGVAATGGYGSVIGTFVGIFVIMLLKTGLPYVGLQANWQQIITGLVKLLVNPFLMNFREVTQMNADWRIFINAAYKISVNAFCHKRNHRCGCLTQRNQCCIQCHVCINLILFHALCPETFTAASYIPVRKLVYKVFQHSGCFRNLIIFKFVVHFFDNRI